MSLGVGKHLKDIAPENIAPALELVYIGEFIAIVACALAKTSFAITLLRTVTSQLLKALLWFIIVTMNTIMWMCAIIYLAQCKPTARLWDFTITEGYCWDPKYAADLAIAAGSYSGAMDFVLAILSWYIVWNLKITRKEKIGVGLAMSLGFFAGAVAIIKTTYLTNLVLVQDFTCKSELHRPWLYGSLIPSSLLLECPHLGLHGDRRHTNRRLHSFLPHPSTQLLPSRLARRTRQRRSRLPAR